MTIDDILDNIGEYRSDIEKLVFHLKNLGIKSLDEFKAAARESGVPIPKSIQDAVESKFISSDDDDWAIAQGKNTIEAYEEYLYAHEDGKYRDAARSAKADLQQKKDKVDSEDAWATVDKTDIECLQSFILNYPDSEHAAEVNKLLRDLKKERYMGVGISALSQQIKDILTEKRINNPVDAIYKKIVDYLQSGKITKDALVEAIRKDYEESPLWKCQSFPEAYPKLKEILDQPDSVIFGMSAKDDEFLLNMTCRRYGLPEFDFFGKNLKSSVNKMIHNVMQHNESTDATEDLTIVASVVNQICEADNRTILELLAE